ncbi:hypothetical protein AQV86_03805 [Nanohaloarchaea archaeon SG9]|nr:hypothetical protein AQV86_03805 [Nanohaloarchaea archaeon SG9]
MSVLEDLVETFRQRPWRTVFTILLIIFWIAVPLISQLYFDMSAVKISFTVTVLYYAGWKLYELQTG